MLRLELLAHRWDHLFRQRLDADRYRVRVVSTPAEYFDRARAPFELRFVIDALPDGFEIARGLLERGFGIGIRHAPWTPPRTMDAVREIAKGSQRGMLEPWISRLIFHEDIPVITEDELADAHDRGIHLYTEAHRILGERYGLLRFVLVDLDGKGIEERDRKDLDVLNQAIKPLAAAYLHHRISSDYTASKIRFISVALRAVLFVGPVAHLFERWVRGIGMLFSALADNVSREIGIAVSLRQSGYTPRQLWRRVRLYLPVLVIDIWLALQAYPLLKAGHSFFAGLLFAIAAVSFPWVSLIQSFADIRSSFGELERGRKLTNGNHATLTGLTVAEIRRDKIRLGLFVGACLAPPYAGLLFWMNEGLASNGWFLAFVAILDVLIALAFAGLLIAMDRLRFIHGVITKKYQA